MSQFIAIVLIVIISAVIGALVAIIIRYDGPITVRIIIGVTVMVLVLAALLAVLTPFSEPDNDELTASIQPQAEPDVSTNQWKSAWVEFPAPLEACPNGPRDAQKRAWYAVNYDDSAWELVAEEELASEIWPDWDSFFRREFSLIDYDSVLLNFRSDDGSWIFVNGNLVGQFGADCGNAGIGSDSVDITDFAQLGDNLIAVHVHNARTASSLEMSILVDGFPIHSADETIHEQ